jgi:hypothetical protein
MFHAGFLSQSSPLIIAAVVVGLINYGIGLLLAKTKPVLVFLLPILLLLFSGLLWILGLTAQDWSALGYLLYAGIVSAAFLGSLLSSLLLWRKVKSS